MILTGALLLGHLGEQAAAGRIHRSVAAVLAGGQGLTPDLGGNASTRELTRRICRQMERE